MGYAFGVDGGGTKARIRVIDSQNRVRAETEGGSTNIYSVGTDTALTHLRQLLETACTMAGIDLGELSAGCVGSAGLTRDKEKAILRAFLRDVLGGIPLEICNDGEILLVGKLRARQGYCLISGTGSLAMARSETGATARAGGMGYMLGDEGSASWIGWQAIRRALRSAEKRDLPTAMLPALLQHFALQKPADFVEMTHHRFEKKRIAAASPLVDDFARRKDALAVAICSQAVDELFLLIRSVIEQLPLAGDIALAGGVLENSALIRDPLLLRLERAYPAHPVAQNGGTALDGACMLAAALMTSPA